MKVVTVKDARRQFAKLIAAAERGASVLITRRGRKVAVMGPCAGKTGRPLPDLAEFRAAIRARGGGQRPATVADLRRDQRY